MEKITTSQLERAQHFKQLHERAGCFIIPNPWNAGTAKILENMGFEALATTSAGLAFSLGMSDGAAKVSLQQTLANASEIVAATALPISCDLENGFSDSAAGVADTIKMAALTGLAGGSIEDSTGLADNPIYSIEVATERIIAAAEAAKNLPNPFILTARAENFLHNRFDLKDTIHRLQHYQEAGADVLFAPGLTTVEQVSSVLGEIDRPLNVLAGISGCNFTLAQLTALGVRRVSVGSALSRAAFGAFITAATDLKNNASFHFANDAIPYKMLNDLFT